MPSDLKLKLINMKKLILILLTAFSSLHSQNKVTNNWTFGNHNGLCFNSGVAVPMTSSLYSYEACSSISDTSGNLLFYTNGNHVWDKTGAMMPNGSGLKGNDTTGQLTFAATSSAQGALIIKVPRKQNQYLIFTSSDVGYGHYYSKVDMTLNSGLGDVTSKNILLNASGTEKLCAVNHSNDTDVWVLIHRDNSTDFAAYKVDSGGVNPIPTVSAGDTYFSSSGYSGTVGQIKFSTDGKKLACANWYNSTPSSVSLYDFNDTTGALSNSLKWNLPNITNDHAYGVEFSPNDSMLYVGSSPGGNLYQYQISSGNLTTIVSSVYNYNIPSSSGGQLQLAVDGNIYYANNTLTVGLSVILAPNYQGILSSFCNACQNTAPNQYISGLPNFNQSYFRGVPNNLPNTTVIFDSKHENVSIGVFPNPTSDQFYIETNVTDKLNLDLYDVNGRHVFSANVSDKENINVATLDEGIYTLKIKTVDRVINKKLVVLR